METVVINGRNVSVDEILEVYKDNCKWIIAVYGQSSVEIDIKKSSGLDTIIERKSSLIDKSIIETRKNGRNLMDFLKTGNSHELDD